METLLRPLPYRFKTAIQQHLASGQVEDDARSVKFYAGLLYVHPNHLNAVVKKKTGKSPLQHIHQQLLDVAKFLLAETALSSKEISYRLAFREPAHFYTFFRKHERTTPQRYRRAFQDGETSITIDTTSSKSKISDYS
jgi:AraC family transcriptional regulator, transcriptional activator of pobA